MNTRMHVKKNDTVVVITGKDKGMKGTVARVLPLTGQVVVDGVNVRKRAIRARRGKDGEIVSLAMPIDASNVRLADKAKKSAK